MRVLVEPGIDGLKPLRFSIGGKKKQVIDVMDHWAGDDYDYFKVRAEDGCVYILKRDQNEGGWELTLYTAYPDKMPKAAVGARKRDFRD